MIVAALRSAATYLAISLYVFVTGPVGMFLAIVCRWTGPLYVFGHGGVRLGLALSGIRYRVVGAEHLPLGRAAVYCSNHESNVDPPLLFATLHPRMHILYKHEINRIPILARAFRLGGFIPIDRRNKESAFKSIEAGAASIRAGNSFLIFPEGTRSRDADLLPFKKGGFVMAITAQAPIVPIAVSGARAAMRKGSASIFPVMVSIRIGRPIETAGLDLADRDQVIDRVRKAIESLRRERPVAAEVPAPEPVGMK